MSENNPKSYGTQENNRYIEKFGKNKKIISKINKLKIKTKKVTILVFKDYSVVTITHFSDFPEKSLNLIKHLKKNKDFVKDYDLNVVFD